MNNNVIRVHSKYLNLKYYDPVSGENPPSVASMFGWSSAFIDLVIQAAQEKVER
jgi:hypothetical protein